MGQQKAGWGVLAGLWVAVHGQVVGQDWAHVGVRVGSVPSVSVFLWWTSRMETLGWRGGLMA